MFIDSHCHLNFPGLKENLDEIFKNMRANQVTGALCVSVELSTLPEVLALAEQYEFIHASVGVHPDYELENEPGVDELVYWARHPKVVAIGETGLDYYRLTGNLDWQRERFRTHIHTARKAGKPLIIHTRSAASDTLDILREEKADEICGVMHCFTESIDVARDALDLGFYISFSGILTFKNASALREVAHFVPMDRILIETDAPYLAPVPHRGKTNQPAFVKHVAEEIARIKGIPLSQVANQTTNNFNRLFLGGTVRAFPQAPQALCQALQTVPGSPS